MRRHVFQALLTPDEECGGYTICALHYPGVVSEGETLEEAKEGISEAFLAMLESRVAHGESMMYSDLPVVEQEENSRVIRIVVDG
ncbi:type II toxin-antitoxin system HicB family antitoxin [Roseiconus nitratireducens]|uniref:Type II toxin-antitoxin system HicB family antitoxin n=1 Tax=Roseiconus nitratireducens TaxID=2605748 RepID=A0A5M6DCS7_9BACT|nr:type II toxin-antitoxin system HicB family antitoxin [Roseiconus nitratireducens]